MAIQMQVSGEWRQAVMAGRGIISDDTEHAIITSLSLLSSGGDVDAFRLDLGRRLRWWLASLPPVVDYATLMACLRLWVGYGPAKSGVKSAGNGPLMRAPIIGAFFADDHPRRICMTDASTRITHIDPRAAVAARAIAEAAAFCAREVRPPTKGEMLALMVAADIDEPDLEWRKIVETMADALALRWSTARFMAELGWRDTVPGYSYATAPAALHAWCTNWGNPRSAIEAALELGGDTDSAAAVTGALVGINAARERFPEDWLQISDWPWGLPYIDALGLALDHARDGVSTPPPKAHIWALPVRNILAWGVLIARAATVRRRA